MITGTVHVSAPFDAAPRDCQFQLCLDPALFSQQIMLSSLQRGSIYEPETSAFLASVLQPGDIFIDVGAHIGYFTLLGATLVGPTGRVLSFEPEQSNYRRLLEHLQLNRLSQVLPFNWAVSSTTRVTDLFINQDNDGGHAFWDVGSHPFNRKSREQPRTCPVFTVALDDVPGSLTLPSLRAIKIDTEGNEYGIVQGARRLMGETRVPFIIAEINRYALSQMGTTEAALREYMSGLGYDTCILEGNGTALARPAPGQFLERNDVFNVVFARRGERVAFPLEQRT
jgi:FkbM family methyltransferase